LYPLWLPGNTKKLGQNGEEFSSRVFLDEIIGEIKIEMQKEISE
jgi:hypothetical protein